MKTSTTAPAARHQLLTVYGRKPVLEALQDSSLNIERLHVAHSNRSGGILDTIQTLAAERGVECRAHDRAALARISRNGRQDQGVALDIRCPSFGNLDELQAAQLSADQRFLLLDGVTNPQNAGMIVRSAAAAGIDGILWPQRGVAALGPLVIKASAGALFRAPIIHCQQVSEALERCQSLGMAIATLDGASTTSVFDYRADRPTVFVLGSESEGVSANATASADISLAIPMANGVESLNVAVAAGILAYATARQPG